MSLATLLVEIETTTIRHIQTLLAIATETKNPQHIRQAVLCAAKLERLTEKIHKQTIAALRHEQKEQNKFLLPTTRAHK